MDIERALVIPLLGRYVRVVGLRWVQVGWEDEGFWEMRLAWWCPEAEVWHQMLVRVTCAFGVQALEVTDQSTD